MRANIFSSFRQEISASTSSGRYTRRSSGNPGPARPVIATLVCGFAGGHLVTEVRLADAGLVLLANGKFALMNYDDREASVRMPGGPMLRIGPYSIVMEDAEELRLRPDRVPGSREVRNSG